MDVAKLCVLEKTQGAFFMRLHEIALNYGRDGRSVNGIPCRDATQILRRYCYTNLIP